MCGLTFTTLHGNLIPLLSRCSWCVGLVRHWRCTIPLQSLKSDFPEIEPAGYITRRDQFALRDTLVQQKKEQVEKNKQDKELQTNRRQKSSAKAKAKAGVTRPKSGGSKANQPQDTAGGTDASCQKESPPLQATTCASKEPPVAATPAACATPLVEEGGATSTPTASLKEEDSKEHHEKNLTESSDKGDPKSANAPTPKKSTTKKRKACKAADGAPARDTSTNEGTEESKQEETQPDPKKKPRNKPQPDAKPPAKRKRRQVESHTIDLSHRPPTTQEAATSELHALMVECRAKEGPHQDVAQQFPTHAHVRLSIYWKASAVGVKVSAQENKDAPWKWTQPYYLSMPMGCMCAKIYCAKQIATWSHPGT